MKRLIIICEGETEQEFCKEVLYGHLQRKDIYIETPLIKKSMGGIVPWKHIKNQVQLHLSEGAFVTTLIDYYGIKDSHVFPGWEMSKSMPNKMERMDFLENSMADEMEDAVRHRFIPYIQLHEFEGLLFNDLSVFTTNFSQDEIRDLHELDRIIQNNENPEMINDGPETAPSKRLGRLIKGYNKIVYGALIAENIGLEHLRSKAVRFDRWVDLLEKI